MVACRSAGNYYDDGVKSQPRRKTKQKTQPKAPKEPRESYYQRKKAEKAAESRARFEALKKEFNP